MTSGSSNDKSSAIVSLWKAGELAALMLTADMLFKKGVNLETTLPLLRPSFESVIVKSESIVERTVA
jgi:hypothetical protein